MKVSIYKFSLKLTKYSSFSLQKLKKILSSRKKKNKTIMKNLLSTLFLATILCYISSCTVQKRTFNKGYFVQWNTNKKVFKTNSDEIEKTIITKEVVSTEEIEIAEIEKETPAISTSDNFVAKEENHISFSKVQNPTLTNTIPANSIESFSKKTSKKVKLIQHKVKKVAPMSGESVLNIVLLVVFLGLAILFTLLALKAAMPLVIVYGVLALVTFILFVTQIFDVFM